MTPGAHNLGNGNQIRDGLEPCPRDELVERLRARAEAQRESRGSMLDYGTPDPELLEAADRLEANQSSLDTMGGRIEELADVLSDLFENPDYTVAIGGNPIMVDRLMERARKALRGPVSRSHAPHQAPVGLGRSGFDRGQSK